MNDDELRLAVLRGVVEDVQPIVAPAFDASMVGKHLEVLRENFDQDTKEPHLIWASGRVVRVADGLSDNDQQAQLARAQRRFSQAGTGHW
ncbi:hypothetical protein AB1Y20_010738 [Prymnesium parvum]|uniref:Uncharacterized protein n=1 Tax=Prymnesium parvum TaxID=97485 RepID=A0AB34IS78_PRYPA